MYCIFAKNDQDSDLVSDRVLFSSFVWFQNVQKNGSCDAY